MTVVYREVPRNLVVVHRKVTLDFVLFAGR